MLTEIVTDEDGHIYFSQKYLYSSNWMVQQCHNFGLTIPEQDSAEVNCSNLTETGHE